MIVTTSDGDVVVSVRSIDGYEYIDSGDTVIIRLKCSDEKSAMIVIPRREIFKIIENIRKDNDGFDNI